MISPATKPTTSISDDVALIAEPKAGKFKPPEFKPEPFGHTDIPPRYRKWSLADFSIAAQVFIKTWMANKQWWSLYLYGAVGTRKSSLAAAALKEWRTHFPPPADNTFAGWFVPIDRLVPLLRNPETNTWCIHDCQNTKLLVFDDIGGNRSTPHVLEQLSNILRARYDNHRKVIITSNLSLEAFRDEVDLRIADRLREGQRMLCGRQSKRQDAEEQQGDEK